MNSVVGSDNDSDVGSCERVGRDSAARGHQLWSRVWRAVRVGRVCERAGGVRLYHERDTGRALDVASATKRHRGATSSQPRDGHWNWSWIDEFGCCRKAAGWLTSGGSGGGESDVNSPRTPSSATLGGDGVAVAHTIFPTYDFELPSTCRRACRRSSWASTHKLASCWPSRFSRTVGSCVCVRSSVNLSAIERAVARVARREAAAPADATVLQIVNRSICVSSRTATELCTVDERSQPLIKEVNSDPEVLLDCPVIAQIPALGVLAS